MIKINKLNLILVAFMIMAMTLAVGCGGGGGGGGSSTPVTPSTTAVANDQYNTAQGLVTGSQAKAPSAATSDLATAITSLNALAGAAETGVYDSTTQTGTVSGTKYDFTTMNAAYGSIDASKLNIQNLLALAYTYQAQALQNLGSSAPALKAVINRAPSLDIEGAFSIMRAVNPNAGAITTALNNARTSLNKGLAIYDANKNNERMKVVKFAEAVYNITKANIDPTITKADQVTYLEAARNVINTELESAKTQIAKFTQEQALLDSLKIKNPIQLEAKAADVYRKIDPAVAERVIDEVQEKVNLVPDTETFKSDLKSSLDISKSLAIISNTNNPIEYVKAKCEELDKKIASQPAVSFVNVNFKIEIVTTIIVMAQNRASEITVSTTFNNFAFTMFGTGTNQMTINDFQASSISASTTKLATFVGDNTLAQNLTKTDSYIVGGFKDDIASAATSSVFVDASSAETSIVKALDSAKKSFAQLKYNYDVSAKTLNLINETMTGYNSILADVTAEIYLRAECRHEMARLYADRYMLTSDEVDIVEAQKLLNIIVYEGEYIGGVKLDYTTAPIFYVSKMFLERVIKMRYYKPAVIVAPTVDKGVVEIFPSFDSKFKITAGESLKLFFNFNQTAKSPIKQATVKIPNLRYNNAIGYEASWNISAPATLEITVNDPGAYDIIVMATAENETVGVKGFVASVLPKPVAVTVTNPLKPYGIVNVSETTVEVVSSVSTLRSKLGIRAWINRSLLASESGQVEIFRDGASVKKLADIAFAQGVMADGTAAYKYEYLSDETLKDSGTGAPIYGNYFVKLTLFDSGNVIYSNGFDFKYFQPQVTEGGVTYTEQQIWQMFETAKTGLVNGLIANDLNAVMGFIQAEDSVEARVFFKNIMDNVTLTNAFFDFSVAVPSFRSPFYTFNFTNATFKLNGTFKPNIIIDGFTPAGGSPFASVVPLDLVLVRTGDVMKFRHTFKRQDFSRLAIQSVIAKFNTDLKNRTFGQPIYAAGIKDMVIKNFADLAGQVSFPALANTEVVAPDLNNIPLVISVTPDGKKVANFAEEIAIFDAGVTPKSLVFKFFVNFNLEFDAATNNWLIKFVNFSLSAFDINNNDIKALRDFVEAVEGRHATAEVEAAYLSLKNKYIGTYGFTATHEIMVMLETLHTKFYEVGANFMESDFMKTENGLFLYMTPASAKSSVPFRTTWNTGEIFVAKDIVDPTGMNAVKNVMIAQDADHYYFKVELAAAFAGRMQECYFNIDMSSNGNNMFWFEQHLRLNPFNAERSSCYGFTSKTGGWSVSGNEPKGASSYYDPNNLTSFQLKIPKAAIFPNMLSADRAELANWITQNKSSINLSAYFNSQQ